MQWIGIILGAMIYEACIWVLDRTGWPRMHDLRRDGRADAAGGDLLSTAGSKAGRKIDALSSQPAELLS